MSKLYDAVTGTQRSPRDRFIEAYNFFFTLICYGAIAASICFTFRNVRGSYRWFTLTDQNATLFFAGSCLILSAVFFAVLRALGPVGHSSANIFWRFPGVVGLPKNPWRVTAVLVALIVWGLLGVLLATVFAPLSLGWLLGTSALLTLFGVFLVSGAQGSQLLKGSRPLDFWAVCACLTGSGFTVLATAFPQSAMASDGIVWGTGTLLAVGTGLCLWLALAGKKKVLEPSEAISAHGRASVLLASLSSVGSPQGYRFYGSSRRFFRDRWKSNSPAALSVAASFDSVLMLAGTVVFSLPFAVFLSVAYGVPGVGIVLLAGCWITATMFRWLAREWTAQPSLRAWLGGGYTRQLVGYCAGPALMTALYALVIVLVFGLPLFVAAVAFLFGLTISLGTVNPPQHINYDLVIVTEAGVVLPVEPVAAVLKALILVGVHALGIALGMIPALVIAGVVVSGTVLNHRLKDLSLSKMFSELWEPR